jgi:hypothetical protein
MILCKLGRELIRINDRQIEVVFQVVGLVSALKCVPSETSSMHTFTPDIDHLFYSIELPSFSLIPVRKFDRRTLTQTANGDPQL